ncbi:MAG: DUF2927 domain-containing protein [Paracoccaceae bacterium]
MSALLAGFALWLGLACQGCYYPGDDWAGYERAALRLGKMRLERRPADLPVSRQALADNFRRIAFGIETDVLAHDDPMASTGGVLRRWRRPVRWAVTSFGPEAGAHRAAVEAMTRRLATATGHAIAPAVEDAGEAANLAVMFLRPEDYAPIAARLAARPGGGWLAHQLDRFGRAGHTPCVGIFLHARDASAGEPDEILYALALIRAGLPERLARACVEEELAQAMGLPNDDADVRPSVFNDDQEFALLTAHDEALLAILYDARLRPGMSEAEAMALVPAIVAGLDARGFSGRR